MTTTHAPDRDRPDRDQPGRDQPDRDRIVDHALTLADAHGWESIRLHQIAAACGLGLDQVRAHFREKDEIIDAWLDRADAAMLQHVDGDGLAGLSARERIRRLIIVWLEALAPYQRVTREMIAHKLEFGHVHVQFPALLRISRTVQWIREGASLDAPLPRRALEESALTALFVKTFMCWLRDHSEHFKRTRERLDRDLHCMERATRWLPGTRFAAGAAHERDPPRRDPAPGMHTP